METDFPCPKAAIAEAGGRMAKTKFSRAKNAVCSDHLFLEKGIRKKPAIGLITGFFGGGELGIRTLGSFWEHSISSAAPSTSRTTLRVCYSAFFPKTFGKN